MTSVTRSSTLSPFCLFFWSGCGMFYAHRHTYTTQHSKASQRKSSATKLKKRISSIDNSSLCDMQNYSIKGQFKKKTQILQIRRGLRFAFPWTCHKTLDKAHGSHWVSVALLSSSWTLPRRTQGAAVFASPHSSLVAGCSRPGRGTSQRFLIFGLSEKSN